MSAISAPEDGWWNLDLTHCSVSSTPNSSVDLSCEMSVHILHLLYETASPQMGDGS
jgi:hypothetical protein